MDYCTVLLLSGRTNADFSPLPSGGIGLYARNRDWSPNAAETDGEAANPGPRLRRRGPRSADACARRLARNTFTQSGAPWLFGDAAQILHYNIRGWVSHSAELTAVLRSLPALPTIVVLTETWLTDAFEEPTLEGYNLVARRDRVGQMGGGVIMFAEKSRSPCVCMLECSVENEVIWAVLHSNQGPYLLCAWYRSPGSGTQNIADLQVEWLRHSFGMCGTVIVGDMNVHSIRWLKFSSGESPEGSALRSTCAAMGLKQLVTEPTRGENLLDLVLCDIAGASATTLGRIADHRGTLTSVQMQIPEQIYVARTLWHFCAADWDKMRDQLAEKDWHLLAELNAESGAVWLTDAVRAAMSDCIPTTSSQEQKSSHPWLTAAAVAAVRRKHEAQGTPHETVAAQICSELLLKELQLHRAAARLRLSTMNRGSKKWWKHAKSVMELKQKVSSIPLLKVGGVWKRTASERANALADVLQKKSALPARIDNEYTPIAQPARFAGSGCHVEENAALCEKTLHNNNFANVLIPSEESVQKTIEALSDDSATGPDGIATRVLKQNAAVLAKPGRLLTSKIIQTGEWPKIWGVHWLCPLHKKKSVTDANNYREIHITSQLSKVCERVIAQVFMPDMIQRNVFGENQFAYLPGRGVRDALAFLVLSWIAGMNAGMKIAVFCSDVSGAFDKVSQELLVMKAQAAGVPEHVVALFRSWMDAHIAHVVVDGEKSDAITLFNMVFQGTVWGPWLWNLFFADASHSVRKIGFTEVIFADDLNCFKKFDATINNDEIIGELQQCQKELHSWGAGNQVSFDPGKESQHVLATNGRGFGENFKILGVLFDDGLTMCNELQRLVAGASWRLSKILRAKHYFSTSDLFLLYKAKVLSYIECRTPAIFHAADTHLESLDAVQRRFLRDINISEENAIMDYNLAPLNVRRNIAMLGVIHRAALGIGPTQLHAFFKKGCCAPRATRMRSRQHSQNLEDMRGSHFLEIARRSALGLVAVYNLLSEELIVSSHVQLFQAKLQNLTKRQLHIDNSEWRQLFSPRVPMYCHPLRCVQF